MAKAEVKVEAAPVVAEVVAPVTPVVAAPEFIEIKPGLRFPATKPTIEGRTVVILGGHPSNTPGVKWTQGQELVWKPLVETGFPLGAEYCKHSGFKDAAGRVRDTYLIRTAAEIQLWAVEV